jgi:hypothetical protein
VRRFGVIPCGKGITVVNRGFAFVAASKED